MVTPLTVRNTSGYPVTLDAEDLCTVGHTRTPLFSGRANPTLLDITVPGDETPLDGAVLDWDERWERFGERDAMQAVMIPDVSRVVVGIAKSTITFTKQ